MLRPTPGDPWGVEQHHWNTGAEENQQLNPGGPIYRAIGLDGCGKLKEHFDHVICGVPENKMSAETQKFMDHGTTNEINAIATVVSKVLPVLYPDLVFYEEGCVEFAYVDNSKFMVFRQMAV